MNIFEVLSNDERVIVLSDKEEGYIYTWNRSCTLQLWHQHFNYELQDSSYEEDDIRTLSNEPANYEAARVAAQAWHYDLKDY